MLGFDPGTHRLQIWCLSTCGTLSKISVHSTKRKFSYTLLSLQVKTGIPMVLYLILLYIKRKHLDIYILIGTYIHINIYKDIYLLYILKETSGFRAEDGSSVLSLTF